MQQVMWIIVIMAFSNLAARAQTASNNLSVTETDSGILVCEAGKRVLLYRHVPASLNGQFKRAGYVHPLYDLTGNIITEDFPDDHPHQRGVFWAWHQLNVGKRKAGDGWLVEDFQWDVRQTTVQRPKEELVALVSEVIWKSSAVSDAAGQPLPLVRECTRITVHATESRHRIIDFDIRLTALQDEMSLGGSDDDKGYGGFSIRLRMPRDVTFLATDGEVQPERTALEAGPWIDIHGSFADDPAETSGIALLCHPSSDGYPQPWILRDKDSMQNAVYPGRAPVPLSKINATTLRYRIVLHRGSVSAATIRQWHDRYAAESFSDAERSP